MHPYIKQLAIFHPLIIVYFVFTAQLWNQYHIHIFNIAVLHLLYSFKATQLCCVNKHPTISMATPTNIYYSKVGWSYWQLCSCSTFLFISGWKEISPYCDILSCGRLKTENKTIWLDKIYNGSQHFCLELSHHSRREIPRPNEHLTKYTLPILSAGRHCRSMGSNWYTHIILFQGMR